MAQRPRVVIIGGGFGGIHAARGLRGVDVDVTLLDRRNYHLFQPLLYQVASAAVSPADISYPLRTMFRKQDNTHVVLAEAVDIDVADRQVVLAEGEPLAYDHLIVAAGASRHNYFGHPEWAVAAPGLKSIEDAVDIRARFLHAFEEAERASDPDERRRLLTFVIVGAGPTGVELAGAMIEMARHALPREFRSVDTRDARVILLEAADRVLPPYPEALSTTARRQLERLGVEVRTGKLVTHIEPGRLELGDEVIETANLFWAAGVAPSPLAARLGAPLERGRVAVGPDLSVPGRPEVFVIGDLAAVTDAKGQRVPWIAPGAMQQGRYVAKAIATRLKGEEPEPFTYTDKGSMAVIGRGSAVANVGPFKVGGWFAWLLWLVVHIWYLIGFRNRLLVLLNWGYAYLGFAPGARLIIDYGARDFVETESSHRPDAGAEVATERAAGEQDEDVAKVGDAPS